MVAEMFGEDMVVDDVGAPPVQAPPPPAKPDPVSSIFDRPIDPTEAAAPPLPPPPPAVKSEVEKYLILPPVPHNANILEWWKAHDLTQIMSMISEKSQKSAL